MQKHLMQLVYGLHKKVSNLKICLIYGLKKDILSGILFCYEIYPSLFKNTATTEKFFPLLTEMAEFLNVCQRV